MKGLDTNVLVRLLVGDDPRQARQAADYIETHCSAEQPGWINRVVLCELVWVLSARYKLDAPELQSTIQRLLETAEFAVEDPDAAWAALRASNQGHDFADAYIAESNRRLGCDATATFDRRAGKLAAFELIE
ncbi:MAG: PIN domain-containing protein [Alphaproteobacteria bacterium]